DDRLLPIGGSSAPVLGRQEVPAEPEAVLRSRTAGLCAYLTATDQQFVPVVPPEGRRLVDEPRQPRGPALQRSFGAARLSSGAGLSGLRNLQRHRAPALERALRLPLYQ